LSRADDASAHFTEANPVAVALAMARNRKSVAILEPFAGFAARKLHGVRATPRQLEHATARVFSRPANRAARQQIARTQELAREALDELRSLILELRPADLERDGLDGALRKHVEVLRQLHGVDIDLDLGDGVTAGDGGRDGEILRIAQEAIQNALRHARAQRVAVRLAAADAALVLEVTDDGVGFDPADPEVRSKRLGLTSMEERAERLRGRLEIRSAPATGTTVRLEASRA